MTKEFVNYVIDITTGKKMSLKKSHDVHHNLGTMKSLMYVIVCMRSNIVYSLSVFLDIWRIQK